MDQTALKQIEDERRIIVNLKEKVDDFMVTHHDKKTRRNHQAVAVVILQSMQNEQTEEAADRWSEDEFEVFMDPTAICIASLIYEGFALHLMGDKFKLALKFLPGKPVLHPETVTEIDTLVLEFGVTQWIDSAIDDWDIVSLPSQLRTETQFELAVTGDLIDGYGMKMSQRSRQYRAIVAEEYEKMNKISTKADEDRMKSLFLKLDARDVCKPPW
jgi:hypothetical protein